MEKETEEGVGLKSKDGWIERGGVKPFISFERDKERDGLEEKRMERQKHWDWD